MIDQLLSTVTTHPTSQHPVFTALADHRLTPSVLASYLRERAAFHATTRPAGDVTDTLRFFGFAPQAFLADKVFTDDEVQAGGFADMAPVLLRNSEFETEDWRGITAEDLSRAACAAVRVFRRRTCETFLDAIYSLGVLFALKLIAHRQIVPGEVDAFVSRGHYGTVLADPPYLAAQSGDSGLGQSHATAVMQIFKDFPVSERLQNMVHCGCIDLLDALRNFYDRLHEIVTSP